MASIKISINSQGAKQGAQEVNQALNSMAEAAVRAVRSTDEIRNSLTRQREAQAQARTSTQQEVAALQQKTAMQRAATAAGNALESATRRLSQAYATGQGALRSFSQSLASIRAEFTSTTAAARANGEVTTRTGSLISGLVGPLRAAAAAYVSFQGAAKFVEIADDVNSLRARIENLSTAAGQGATIFEKLQASAKELGIPLKANVEFFTQLSFAASGLGKSNADLLKITDTLQKIGAVGRISAEDMSAALLQLGQVFAQGKFQADELNVILTRAPKIVEEIALGLGRSAKEATNLARAGKLEVNDVLDAILKRSTEVNKQFESIPANVGRATASASTTIGQAIDAVNQKFAITETIAKGILNIAGRISQAFDLDTQSEKLARMKRQLADLQAEQAKPKPTGIAGFFSGLRGDDTFRQQNIENLQKQIGEVEAASKKADAALQKTTEVVKSGYIPTQDKAAESIRKHNAQLQKHADTLNLTGEALAKYEAAAVLKETGDKKLADETYRAVLADERAKAAKEAATKATQKQAEAEREAARVKKEAEQDLIKANALVNELNEKKRKADKEDEEANAKSLLSLQEEIAQLHEEGRVIEASLGPKEELQAIERQIAKERINRQAATDLVQASEHGLTDEEREAIETKRKLAVANLDASEAVDTYKESIENAALTTNDLKTFTQGILSGTQSLSNLFEDLGQTMGARLIQGVLFGKSQDEKAILGNFNDLLGIDAAGIFGAQGTNLGNTLVSSILDPILSGGNSLLQSAGINFGNIFGSSAVDAASVTWEQTSDQIFAAGGAPFTSAQAGGVTLGEAFGGAALGAAGTVFGKGLAGIFGIKGKEAGIGGSVGGGVGGLAGFLVGGPIGAGIGSALGGLLGSVFGSFFSHTPSKGTQVRKGVKDFLKDIKASFADEIDSNDYFFEETKKLAKKMFGGDDGKDFLQASKQILNDKIGPELAKQLQALGAFVTAEQARKLNKSVEQTGTTFGNLLLDNLGLDPDEIDNAVQEIIQKANITFPDLINKLNNLFDKDKIGTDFFQDAIMGAVEIFNSDLPDAINVSAIALKSFSEDGLFDIDKFQTELAKVTSTFEVITNSFVEAVQNDEPGVEVGKLLGEQIMKGLEQLAVDAFLSEFVDKKLFEGIDLSDGLGADELQKIIDRAGEARKAVEDIWNAFGGPGKEGAEKATEDIADDLDKAADKAKELFDTLRDLTQQRFQLRLDVLNDLSSIGAIGGVEAARGRIGAGKGVLKGLGASTRTDFSDAELAQGLDAIRSMRQATVDLFRAQEAEAREALQNRINDIRADFAARRDALQKEAQAAQEAAQARLEQLSKEKDAVQQLFQDRLDGLQKELQVAQDFRQLAQSLQQTISGLVQSNSPFSQSEKLASAQERAAQLRQQIAGAPRERHAELIQELSSVLQDQLTAGREFLDPTRFSALFNGVVAELENLRDQSTAQGDRVESIQVEIANTSAQMAASLASIDARAEQVRADAAAQQEAFQAQADALSQQEQAAIAAAERETSLRIDQLREEAAAEIRNLALIEDAILAAQQERVRAQLDLSAEQLSVLQGILHGIYDLENSLITAFSGITSAASGFDGNLTRPQLFLAHPGEHVSITPAGQSTGPISVNTSIAIGVQGGGNNPAATEEAIIQAIADDLRKRGKIARAIKDMK